MPLKSVDTIDLVLTTKDWPCINKVSASILLSWLYIVIGYTFDTDIIVKFVMINKTTITKNIG